MGNYFTGGSYSVGTKDGALVYLDRYTGPDGTGDLVVTMSMAPDDARRIAQALIDKANEIDLGKPDSTSQASDHPNRRKQ